MIDLIWMLKVLSFWIDYYFLTVVFSDWGNNVMIFFFFFVCNITYNNIECHWRALNPKKKKTSHTHTHTLIGKYFIILLINSIFKMKFIIFFFQFRILSPLFHVSTTVFTVCTQLEFIWECNPIWKFDFWLIIIIIIRLLFLLDHFSRQIWIHDK